MKIDQRGFTHVLLIAICAVLIGTLVYTSFFKKSVTTEQQSPSNPVPVSQSNEVSVFDIAFDLPSDWELVSTERGSRLGGDTGEVLNIRVPDANYTVIFPVSIYMPESLGLTELGTPIRTVSGAMIYSDPCGGGFDCHLVYFNNRIYAINIDVPKSSEQPPQNLDAPWSPSTSVTRDDMLNFVATIHIKQ